RRGVAALDQVAEYWVEPDPGRRDAGAGAFAALELRDPVARLAGAAEELAERLAPPRADEPALVEHGRRLVDERLLQQRPELLEGLDLSRDLGQQRRGSGGDRSAQLGERRQREPQP